MLQELRKKILREGEKLNEAGIALITRIVMSHSNITNSE